MTESRVLGIVECSNCGHRRSVSGSEFQDLRQRYHLPKGRNMLSELRAAARWFRCSACGKRGASCGPPTTPSSRQLAPVVATPVDNLCEICEAEISPTRQATAPEGARHTRCFRCQKAWQEAAGLQSDRGARRFVTETWGDRNAWARDRGSWRK